MPLTEKQVEDVCLGFIGTHERCRYLAEDDDVSDVFYCIKKTGKKSSVDVNIDNFIRDTRKKGHDPYKENIPMGDNCSGYPVMKYIDQGYDVDK